ncbi:MAG: PilN domain-containing protein [Dissulfurimicrobium hydrothermale]|uniref:PilN domain-containing protein n=1 Tax=Dissulfurimicrobium hydrothermale TaxID=1750598 RepID=UPI003C75598F
MAFHTEIIGIYADEDDPQVFGLRLGPKGWAPFDIPEWPGRQQGSFYNQLKVFLQAFNPSRRRRFCLALPQRYCFFRELAMARLIPAEAAESVRLGIELHSHLDKSEIYYDQYAFERNGETIVLLAYIRRAVLDPLFKVFSETGHKVSLGPVSPAFVGLDILIRRGKAGFPCVVLGRQGGFWYTSLHGETVCEGVYTLPIEGGRDVSQALLDLSSYVPAKFFRLIPSPAYIVDPSGSSSISTSCQDPCHALPGISRFCGKKERLSWGLCAAVLGLSMYPAISFQETPRRPPLILRINPFQAAVLAMGTIILLNTCILGVKFYGHSIALKSREAELAALDKKLKPLLEIKKKVDGIKGEMALMTRFKDEFPRPLDVLRLLTVNTPQDTWIQNLTIKDDKLRITAEGNSASQVTTEWRKLPFCAELKFTSPVMKDNNQKERFSVEITLTNQKGTR